MHSDKSSFTSRLANAGLLVRAAVSEMTGRDKEERSYGAHGAINAIRARFGMYKDISTFDISRTSYSMARAIFYANLYSDRKTGKEYGKEYLLGAPFGKPIVNIAAGFAVGSPIQITESHEITEDDDTIENDPNAEPELDDDGEPIESAEVVEIENPTVSNVNRMLQDRRDIIFKTVRNSYRDGDFFITVEDDGEFIMLPPEDVDVITNPSNPDSIDGYDIWTSFPDPDDPTGTTVITYVDEIRRTYRERMVIDKQNKRTPVPGTRLDYRSIEDGGLEERELPIVHFANEQEARSLYGISEFQNLYFLMANYHAILSAAIKGNIYNSTSVPVIQGVKNMKQFLSQNFQQDKDGNYSLKWDNQKMLVVGEGGSVQMLQGDGTAADASTLLNILFYLICQTSETPEFAFGTAVQSSKASVSEQTPMLIKKAIRKQGELEKPVRKLVELYISRMATIRPEEFDAETEFTISMPEILDEDLNINIQIVNALLEKGIITEETAMLMLNLGKYVKNFSDERKKAQAQKKERNPIPTDVFGQPMQSQDDEEDEINQAKKDAIKEMLDNPATKSVAEMLSKNLNALSLEQIQEMNPNHKRGSEGTNPKAIQETKAIPVKSGNPYRDGNGRFGSGKAIADKDDVGKDLTAAADMEVTSYDEMLEQRIALTEIKEGYAKANDELDDYETSNKLILEWTQDSDATHAAMEKAGKLAKDGKGDMAFEYKMAQAYFKERGITEIELYRGISGDEATRISDMVTATNFVTLAPDYASSWTSDLSTANKFTQYNGVIIKRTVPVKDIMAAWNINPHMSTYGESEFIVVQGQVVKLTGDDVGRIRYETNKD